MILTQFIDKIKKKWGAFRGVGHILYTDLDGRGLVVPTSSQSLAVKEFHFTARGICQGFIVKFLAANLAGN